MGEEVNRKCDICGMNTAQKVIESNYLDTASYVCLVCGQEDEEII